MLHLLTLLANSDASSCSGGGDSQTCSDIELSPQRLAQLERSCPEQAELPWRQQGTEDIAEWIRRSGGYVSPSLVIDTGPLGRGIFATAPIAQGEAIVSVPVDLIIKEGDHPCSTVEKLRQELLLGECSFYWPYLRSMQHVAVDIPNAWGSDELVLLDGLPSEGWRKHTGLYQGDCPQVTGGPPIDDAFAMRALMLYVSRSGPLGMQPYFDLFNHGYNSTRHYERDGKHTFYTARPHAAGEEIFNTFFSGAGAGRDVVRRMLKAGAQVPSVADTLSGYGFVEQPPVLWAFAAPEGGREHRFIIESAADPAGSVLPMSLIDNWADLGGGGALSESAEREVRALAADARAELARLEARRAAHAQAGLHCAAAMLGATPQPAAAALCGLQLEPSRRQKLALEYRAAHVAALKAAAAAAERMLGKRAA